MLMLALRLILNDKGGKHCLPFVGSNLKYFWKRGETEKDALK